MLVRKDYTDQNTQSQSFVLIRNHPMTPVAQGDQRTRVLQKMTAKGRWDPDDKT